MNHAGRRDDEPALGRAAASSSTSMRRFGASLFTAGRASDGLSSRLGLGAARVEPAGVWGSSRLGKGGLLGETNRENHTLVAEPPGVKD